MDLLRFRAWLKKEQKMDNEIDHISWLEMSYIVLGMELLTWFQRKI